MNRTIGLISSNYTVAGYAELTEKRPPASIPFGGRYRLMDFALSNLVNSRITTVGFITPYYYRSLLDHMGAGKEWGLDRKEGGLFVLPGSVFGFRDGEGRFLLRDIVRNERFLEQGDGDYVLMSDCSLLYNADYESMITHHELSGKPLTFLYKRVEPQERRRGYYLTRREDGSVTSLAVGESGEYLFLNCLLINRSFLRRLILDFRTVGYRDFFALLGENLDAISAGSFEYEGYVGFTDGLGEYMRSSMALLEPQVRHQLFPAERQVFTKIHDEPPTLYMPGSQVRNSVVSSGSIIEGTVENSILFREVRVEKGAVVRNCVVMERGVIRRGASLSQVICDKDVTIGEGVVLAGTAERPALIPKGKTL